METVVESAGEAAGENVVAGGHTRALDARSLARKCLPYVLLIFAAFSGLTVRLPWTTEGMPYTYNWDEPEILQPAFRILRNGDFVPMRYDHGPLNSYIHAAWGAVSFLRADPRTEITESIWPLKTDKDTGWYWTVSMPVLWQDARVLSALFGALTAMLVGFVGWQIRGPALGIGSALVMAWMPAWVYSTIVVSTDAQALLFTSVALLCSVVAFRFRRFRYIAIAAVAAGLATACKYTYGIVAVLPLAAVLSTHWTQRGLKVLLAVSAVGIFAVTLGVGISAALFDPAKFLHDLYHAKGYYKSSGGEPPLSTLAWGYVTKFLAISGSGDFQGSVPGAFGVVTPFKFYWPGLLLTGLSVWGIWKLLRWDGRIASALIALVVLTFLSVGGSTVYYFTRYALPALPVLSVASVLGAYGVGQCIARATSKGGEYCQQRAKIVAAVVLLVALSPHFYTLGRLCASATTTTDARILADEYIRTNMPANTSVAVAAETRFFIAPQTKDSPRYRIVPIERMRFEPSSLDGVDYLILPTKMQSFNSSADIKSRVETTNAWLASLKPERLFGDADRAMFFRRPTTRPGMMLVRLNDAVRASMRTEPRPYIFGPELGPLQSRAWASVNLGDATLAVPDGIVVSGKIRLPGAARLMRVSVRAFVAREPKEAPILDVQIASTTDTAFTRPIVRREIGMDRTRSGMGPYEAGLGGGIPAGEYLIRAYPKSDEKATAIIEKIEFGK